jgi:hypothetical protein
VLQLLRTFKGFPITILRQLVDIVDAHIRAESASGGCTTSTETSSSSAHAVSSATVTKGVPLASPANESTFPVWDALLKAVGLKKLDEVQAELNRLIMAVLEVVSIINNAGGKDKAIEKEKGLVYWTINSIFLSYLFDLSALRATAAGWS